MKLNLSNYYVSINTIGGHVKRNMYNVHKNNCYAWYYEFVVRL